MKRTVLLCQPPEPVLPPPDRSLEIELVKGQTIGQSDSVFFTFMHKGRADFNCRMTVEQAQEAHDELEYLLAGSQ